MNTIAQMLAGITVAVMVAPRIENVTNVADRLSLVLWLRYASLILMQQ
ncbi:MAG: hypothetical protein ACRCTR_01920 [Actinomycetota bacterium]